jgi:hypothetical protein
MSVDAARASPESDLTDAASASWDALHVCQLISAPVWPAPQEHTQPVPVSACSAQLAAPPALEPPHALAACPATSFQQAAASGVAPSPAPPAAPASTASPASEDTSSATATALKAWPAMPTAIV